MFFDPNVKAIPNEKAMWKQVVRSIYPAFSNPPARGPRVWKHVGILKGVWRLRRGTLQMRGHTPISC